MHITNLQQQAEILTKQYPWEKFSWGLDPSKYDEVDLWAFRYLIACIAVGGSAEASVLTMAPELFAKYPTLKSFCTANRTDIANILESVDIKYAGSKAKYMIESANMIDFELGGKVPDNRKELERLPGVGRHVASVILATVFGQEEFAVDLHVRRIMQRWGYAGSDLALEKIVKENVSPELWGHFSRAFVDFGQTRCSFHTKCNGCPIPSCISKTEEVKKPSKVVKEAPSCKEYTITAVEGGWEFRAPGSDKTCIVRHNGTCNCTGYRYRKTCRHTEHMKAVA